MAIMIHMLESLRVQEVDDDKMCGSSSSSSRAWHVFIITKKNKKIIYIYLFFTMNDDKNRFSIHTSFSVSRCA